MFSFSRDVTFFNFGSKSLVLASKLAEHYVRECPHFFDTCKKLAEQGTSKDENEKDPKWIYDEILFKDMISKTFTIELIEDEYQFDTALAACHRIAKPTSIYFHPQYLLQIAKFERDSHDAASSAPAFKKRKLSAAGDDDVTELECLLQDPQNHVFLLFAKILHELAHILHYHCCPAFRKSVDDSMEVASTSAQIVTSPPKYVKQKRYQDMGNMVEVSLFGGIIGSRSQYHIRGGVDFLVVLIDGEDFSEVNNLRSLNLEPGYLARLYRGELVLPTQLDAKLTPPEGSRPALHRPNQPASNNISYPALPLHTPVQCETEQEYFARVAGMRSAKLE